MKKLFFLSLAILMVFPACTYMTLRSDGYVRNRVIKLRNEATGQCTGVQVLAPSGKSYVLTAGHCKGLVEAGKVRAFDEQNNEVYLDFVEESPTADLMLLSAPSKEGVVIADKVTRHEKVHAMTHGKGYPTYRTDGELLSVGQVEFAEYRIDNQAQADACSMPKNKIDLDMGSCNVVSFEMMSTAAIVPGSSGGPLLDDAGSLVGIASCTDGYFGSYVTLDDIKNFMKGR